MKSYIMVYKDLVLKVIQLLKDLHKHSRTANFYSEALSPLLLKPIPGLRYLFVKNLK